MEQYKSISAPFETSFTEKKSEFIGQIAPAQTEQEANDFIQSIRKKHYNATHNVPAFIIRNGDITRCSDDGEPQGTAGVPVLEVLKKQELVDVALVVTRYFGGTLLGAGGLVRAYSHAAALAASGAPLLAYTECIRLFLQMEYSYYGSVMNLLSKQKHIMEKSDFGADVTLEILLPTDDVPTFKKAIVEFSSAQIQMEERGNLFVEIN